MLVVKWSFKLLWTRVFQAYAQISSSSFLILSSFLSLTARTKYVRIWLCDYSTQQNKNKIAQNVYLRAGYSTLHVHRGNLFGSIASH